MTQIATVEKVFPNGSAEISVPRKSACGHDCEDCAGCGVSGASVRAVAENPIHADPGDKVVVESSTKRLFGMCLIVYIVPVIFFFLGYFLPPAAVTEGARIAIGGAVFCLGLVPALLFDRYIKRKGRMQYKIVRLF